MVAVTVVLVAATGATIVDLTDGTRDSSPTTRFSSDYNGSTLTLTHIGGDTVDAENLYVTSEEGGKMGNYAGTSGQACKTPVATVKPGQVCHLSESTTGDVWVVWVSDSESSVLFRSLGGRDVATSPSTSTPTATPTPTPTPTATPTPTPTATPTPTPTPTPTTGELLSLDDQTAGTTTTVRSYFTIQPGSDTIGNSLNSYEIDMDDSSLKLFRGTSLSSIKKAGVDKDGDGSIDLKLSDKKNWNVKEGGSRLKIGFGGSAYTNTEAGDTIIIVFDEVTAPDPGVYTGDIQTSGDGNYQQGEINVTS